MNVDETLKNIRDYVETIDDEWTRYRLAEFLAEAAYPKFKFSEYSRIAIEDQAFHADYEKFMDPNNWHSYDRKYFANRLAAAAVAVPGDYVECGVYQGATAYLICKHADAHNRKVYLYDSFEGLSDPDPKIDGEYWQKGGLNMPLETAQKNLKPFKSATFRKGWIPKSFEAQEAPDQVCLLHVDVDLYQPTYDSLAFFFPRLSVGGVVLLDDYGFKSCPGAKKAADDYFKDRQEIIADLPTGQAIVVKLP